MLNAVFCLLMGCALLYGLIRGQGSAVVSAMLDAAREAVGTGFSLAGAFGFFCGMMGILQAAGVSDWLSRRISPLLRPLLGKDMPREALPYAAMNLAANALGLGNAATPMGIEAAKRMATMGDTATNALCMFLVINASSVQFMPTTVIAMRAAEGSAAPGAVVLPTILATGVSTLTGIAACKLWEKRK